MRGGEAPHPRIAANVAKLPELLQHLASEEG